MDSLEGFVCDDDLVLEPLREQGWQVESLSWRRPNVDWDNFAAVVIRSTWDYQAAPGEFLASLARIEASRAHLENCLEIVRWNLRKTYLKDLASRGVPVVPTRWLSGLDLSGLRKLFTELGTDEIVLKPLVGANADQAFRIHRDSLEDLLPALFEAYRGRNILAQPFVPAILNEGEFSLFYFGGEFSHCILKTPRPGDFRVQEEHGGDIRPVPAAEELLEHGRRAMAGLERTPLYGRVDLVRAGPGRFWLMELELIEPALYFRMDPHAPVRFARVFAGWMKRRPGG